MPQSISFDRFEAGLDLRKGESVSDANRLRELYDAYITNGRAIRKRPCLTLIATLEAGTVGLKGGKGKLNTFYGSTAVVHADTLFQANRVDHPTTTAEPTIIHYSDTFLGYLYVVVEYDDGTIRHHYVDVDSASAWVTATTYTIGAFVQPTVANGYKYEMTSGKVNTPVTMTIAAPCVVTFNAHGMLAGDPIKFTTTGALPTGIVAGTTYYVLAPAANTFNVAATVGGAAITTTGSQSGVHTVTRQTGISSVQPVWPVVPGTTIVENTGVAEITWTCRSTAILDVNCPNTKIAITQGSKIYAGNGETVRYCATNFPRDWTTASDAGFLPVGIQATGQSDCTALGQFKNQLAVFFADSTQIWSVDADPANNSIISNVENVGTLFSKSPAALSGDLFFLAPNGIRSVSVITLTDNFQDNDVGSPIDSIIQSAITEADEAESIYYPGLGQFWLVSGARVYVYSFSRSAKIAAWSIYRLPFVPDAVTVLNSQLYIRQGDDVYLVDRNATSDNGTPPTVEIRFPFLDCKSPGILKQFIGLDSVQEGTANIQFGFDSRDNSLMTDVVEISGDSRPDALVPMEICAVSLSPYITHTEDETFQLDLMTLYYENLGNV
jgi:hypothetical protein